MDAPVPARHQFEEHTGEVEMVLHAATLAELYVQAGRALAELMLGDEPVATQGEVRDTVVVSSADRESLLVDWLNELIFKTETHKAVFTYIDIIRLTDREIAANLRGPLEPSLKTAVKAATLHRLGLEERDGVFSARVVLDI